jgi:hypothetical protein
VEIGKEERGTIPRRDGTGCDEEERKSRSLHCAAGARVRERRKKPAAPVGMTVRVATSRNVGAKAPTPNGAPVAGKRAGLKREKRAQPHSASSGQVVPAATRNLRYRAPTRSGKETAANLKVAATGRTGLETREGRRKTAT